MARRKGFKAVTFTESQYRIVLYAVEAIRHVEGDSKIPINRAVELICADFLSGPYRDTGYDEALRDPWEEFLDSHE